MKVSTLMILVLSQHIIADDSQQPTNKDFWKKMAMSTRVHDHAGMIISDEKEWSKHNLRGL